MASPVQPRAAVDHTPSTRRRVLAGATLAALLAALLVWCSAPPPPRETRIRVDRSPAPGKGEAPDAHLRAVPAPIDPLQPPTTQLEVTACSEIDAPVELYGSAAGGGWTGGLLTERVGTCDPGPDGLCGFSDLAAGQWVLRQGEVVRGLWLKGGPGAWLREVALPCDHSCAVDLVVDADPACGEQGTLRVLPPRPLPADAQPDPRSDLTWTTGRSQRVDQFPCGTVTVALASAGCRQVHTLPDPEGAPLRALRLHLAPVDRITLRFVDGQSGAPIPGVTLKDADGWTVLVSDENGAVEAIKQPEGTISRAILQAYHPDYQSTPVFPPTLQHDLELVQLHRRQELRVQCEVDGVPCPGHTRLLPTFAAGPAPSRSTYLPGGGIVNGSCVWESPGIWRCERGRDFSVEIELDERSVTFQAADDADLLHVDMTVQGERACLRGDWPSEDCVLQLAETVHPVRQPTELVPLPEGKGPVHGRVVCEAAVTWAEVQLDRGGACTSPGAWAELAGICARPTDGAAVEETVGGRCVLADAPPSTGGAPRFARRSPPFLERCPSWFPPGEYLVGCGSGELEPVTLVSGEVLEWRPPAP